MQIKTTIKYHLTPVRMAIIKKSTTNAGEGVERKGTLLPQKKSYGQPRQHIKKQRHYFANKGLYSQSYGFSSSHI